MVEKSPGPNHKGPSQPHEPPKGAKAGGLHYGKGGQLKAKPMTFLGMYFDADQAAKLWDSIIQTVNSQIRSDQDKAVQAIKNFGKISQGEDPD